MYNDLIQYRGAYLYPVDGGYEGNYHGFHYSADTLDDLKSKIDMVIESQDDINSLNLYSANPRNYDVEVPMFSFITEDSDLEEDELQWLVQFQLEPDEIDDSFEDNLIKEAIIQAPDINTATRYADQYIRKMQKDDTVKDDWSNAEIISIEKYNS